MSIALRPREIQSRQDLSFGGAVSCCMAGDFL